MRTLQIVAAAAVTAAFLASSLPTRAHVPEHCLTHSIRVEQGAADYSRELRELSAISRALSAAHKTTMAAGTPEAALEALLDFYENGWPEFREAVTQVNKTASETLEASADTVLCAHGLE